MSDRPVPKGEEAALVRFREALQALSDEGTPMNAARYLSASRALDEAIESAESAVARPRAAAAA